MTSRRISLVYPNNVLIAFDGSPLSELALTYALETFSVANFTALYVINPIDSILDVEAGGLPVAEDWYDNARERARRLHASATDLAAEYDVDLDTITEIGKPERVILEYVDDNGVDQIVMGNHGRSGLDRMLLGSVAETVTRRARIPVTTIG